MATVQVQTEVSLPALLQGVQQLDSSTLEQFADAVMLLRAKRRAPSLPSNEVELLQRINQGLPEATRARFATLKGKRQAATLTDAEHDELLAIVDQIEERDVERLQALTELAQFRHTSVRELMDQLGLTPAHNG